MTTATITITDKTATVHDFIGFTPEWDEIMIPVDWEVVRALEAQGYEIEFTSEDI